MGWIGSTDTLEQVRLTFETKEDAVAYAKKHGIDCGVQEPQKRRWRPKSYADNFRLGPPDLTAVPHAPVAQLDRARAF